MTLMKGHVQFYTYTKIYDFGQVKRAEINIHRYIYLLSRKMLYKVGEKTGKLQLNALRAILLSQGVEDEIQDESMGIWKCLDLLEDCLAEEEFFSLLKVVYKNDAQCLQLLTDFLNGTHEFIL